MTSSRTAVLAALLALAAAPAARAQGWSEGWTGQFTLYGWLPTISGDQTNNEDGFSVGIDSEDVLSSLDFAFFSAGQIRRDRLGLLFDFNYARLSADGGFDKPRIGVGVKTTLSFATAAVSWRFLERDATFAEAYAGARAFDTEGTFKFRLGQQARQVSAEADWVDPIVGVRGAYSFTPKWSVAGFADVGGFDGSEDLSWEVFGGANYAFNEHFSGVLGYRYLSVLYSGRSLDLDIDLHGPMLGVTYRF